MSIQYTVEESYSFMTSDSILLFGELSGL